MSLGQYYKKIAVSLAIEETKFLLEYNPLYECRILNIFIENRKKNIFKDILSAFIRECDKACLLYHREHTMCCSNEVSITRLAPPFHESQNLERDMSRKSEHEGTLKHPYSKLP